MAAVGAMLHDAIHNPVYIHSFPLVQMSYPDSFVNAICVVESDFDVYIVFLMLKYHSQTFVNATCFVKMSYMYR